MVKSLVVEVSFNSAKLANTLNSDKATQKAYGRDQAKKIQARLTTLQAGFDNMGELLDSGVPGKWHPLRADRADQVACSLVEPWRLIVEPVNPGMAMNHDGSINWRLVTSVVVIEIVDYHE
jgi:toxin HigB-1